MVHRVEDEEEVEVIIEGVVEVTETAAVKVKRSSEISLELSATIAKNSGTLPLNVKVRSWQTQPRLRRDVITSYDFHQ